MTLPENKEVEEVGQLYEVRGYPALLVVFSKNPRFLFDSTNDKWFDIKERV